MKDYSILIIDEFQEFDSENSSIFSDIQNLWDRVLLQKNPYFLNVPFMR
ncbi:hypothetical protein PSM36_0782 [Proteiniphilum saccharofermentans]|jgi:hypothetical protein|uniref:Uncharacterized protein n=1 Tax=Proteiniphilum saccharofermentans TaxID=1642647 RepID=A0A1R3T2Z8_9BACT|nr:hypothetical protein PSM36_0782 [Proteiniphilum saccharofermentans]